MPGVFEPFPKGGTGEEKNTLYLGNSFVNVKIISMVAFRDGVQNFFTESIGIPLLADCVNMFDMILGKSFILGSTLPPPPPPP